MIYTIEVILTILCLFVFILVIVLFIQTISSIIFKPSNSSNRKYAVNSVILVPAHNEELTIKKSLSALQAQLKKNDKILVVADNCDDSTASIVRSMNIEVIERFDKTFVGKSYALDFGVKHIAKNPPDVVIIFDADCSAKGNAIDSLISRCITIDRPVQCLYLMLAPKGAGIKIKIAAFAWLFKNWVRPLGYSNMGLPCQLMGSGMAFPWRIISTANLASGSIVEDLKLGLDCAESGVHPDFYPLSVVTSEFPVDAATGNTQRTRWEHGHLAVILSDLPSYFKRAIIKREGKLLAMLIDAAIPPLALLAMIQMILTTLASVFVFFGVYLPLLISLLTLLIFMISIMSAWFCFGRSTIKFSELLAIPVYILKKIPLYIKFIFDRQSKWVKTKRD